MYTAPSTPSWISIAPSVFDGDYGVPMTWSWQASSAGTNNLVTGYRLEMQKCMDASSWVSAGSWSIGNMTSQESTGGSLVRGEYMRLRIQAIGAQSDSGWSPWSNASRKNTLPKSPSTVSASPLNYSNENVTVSWSGAAGGASSISRFVIEHSTSTNASSWGAWSQVATINTSSGSGSVSVSPSRSVGTYTRYRVCTVDTLNARSEYTTSNYVYCSIGSCGAPSSCSVNTTLSEGAVTLSWSGATSGAGNTISSYEIQYSESSDNVNWGAWTALATTTTTATSGSVNVSPPATRGNYRRFQVRTRGSAGTSYYSGWRVSSNSVRKNTLPSQPAVFAASPTLYQGGDVTLAWSGAAAGTSAIKNYVIQVATSDNNSTWGANSVLATVTTSSTSGSYVYTPGTMAAYTRYRICTTDALNAISSYRTSNTVGRNNPPHPPRIVAPQNGKVTYNKNPRILIQTQPDPDGNPQTIYVKTASGQWLNSGENGSNFSKTGAFESDVPVIFMHDNLPPGPVTVTVNSRDEHAASGDVSISFAVTAPSFEDAIANKTVVKAAHILTLRSAANAMRDYYGLAAYAWASEVMAGKTEVKEWSKHILELRSAVDAVIDKINAFDPNGKFSIPSVKWLPLRKGRPRADVMIQLQEIITQL